MLAIGAGISRNIVLWLFGGLLWELEVGPGALAARRLGKTPVCLDGDAVVDAVDGTVIERRAGTRVLVVVELHFRPVWANPVASWHATRHFDVCNFTALVFFCVGITNVSECKKSGSQYSIWNQSILRKLASLMM